MRLFKQFIVLLTLLIFVVSCSGSITPTIVTAPTGIPPEPTSTILIPIPEKPVLLTPAGLPEDWYERISKISTLQQTEKREDANLIFQIRTGKADDTAVFTSTKVYVVSVPFFTVRDGIDSSELKALWSGKTVAGEHQTIIVSEETLRVLTDVWGKSGKNVSVVSQPAQLDYCEQHPDALAIFPFEDLFSRWKVLKIDGLSPLDKPMVENKYALTVRFSLISQLKDRALTEDIRELFANALPVTNRDESRMTVLMMTGTTAITRVLAYKISIKGMDYPIGAVRGWFEGADLKHVSNESPLVEGCPVPHEFSTSLVFCTPPEMIEVLELLGINVIELTGNHINDHGPENLVYTLDAYQKRGWSVYAAGVDPDQARSPELVESNGNKLAFIGCNAVGPATVYATEARAGAAECDLEYLTDTIKDLKNQGYVVVTTYQHEEVDNLMYFEKISKDFQLVARAGADIVQGSQAHSPMGMEFIGSSFIHYGLGNFLFDQIVEWNRREFIDRHIIYDGEYINTELLTAMLVDWSRPTPMNDNERVQLLDEVFKASLKRKNENK